jgi:hypothetical protein
MIDMKCHSTVTPVDGWDNLEQNPLTDDVASVNVSWIRHQCYRYGMLSRYRLRVCFNVFLRENCSLPDDT